MAKAHPWSKNRKNTQKGNWSKSQDRKEARRNAQNAAHSRNLATIAEGGKTPWQRAKDARKARHSA
jgi:hypothetical protein